MSGKIRQKGYSIHRDRPSQVNGGACMVRETALLGARKAGS